MPVGVDPTEFFEEEARRCGYRLVAGLDEAGRGPLAGPVVAAAVLLPRRFQLPGLNDSKLVGEGERERLAEEIVRRASGVGIGVASAREIDVINILEASRLAMVRAIQALTCPPEFLLTDAVALPTVRLPQRAIIKGDRLSVTIAAASIMAKVIRDGLMRSYHRRYPQYKFEEHKGYPTPEHLALLARYGPSEIHRRTFRPVQAISRSPTPAAAGNRA